MVDWPDLTRELDAWAEDGRTATFWWRDDDAVEVTPALEKLLQTADDAETPLSLAVIPGALRPDLVSCVNGRTGITAKERGVSASFGVIAKSDKDSDGIDVLTSRLHEIFNDPIVVSDDITATTKSFILDTYTLDKEHAGEVADRVKAQGNAA